LLVLLIAVLYACGAPAGPLPRSMKGYELYSWQQDGQWHFTLITGTNRNKNIEEIISDINLGDGSDNGWVNIHVTGVAAVKAVLKRIPADEWVLWQAQGFVIPPEEAKAKLALPPEGIVNEIKDYVKQFGYTFNVAESQQSTPSAS
jgi:hypothetical protein